MVPRLHADMEAENTEKGIARKTEDSNKKITHADRLKSFLSVCWRTLSKSGRDDPKRVIHSLKVGIALTLVSLLYLLEPLYNGIGSNAIWAVMTVVVVTEFTAGATLCKGMNRALGTFFAAIIAFLIQFVASEAGRMFQAAFIGIAVFIIGAGFTYIRLVPFMKKNYDYGVMIFILTFNLIIVTSYRKDQILDFAKERIYNIAIGCAICLCMTLFVFPNWSGENLHNNTVIKLEGLAQSVKACVYEYFRDDTNEEEMECNLSEDIIYEGYKVVLDSKMTDETLALHASWEPRRRKGCYKLPWQQYVKVGAVLRGFSYTVVALHGCLQTEIQTPASFRALFKDPCIRLAEEVSKALMELAESIRSRRHFSPEILSDNLQEALHDLNVAIKSHPRLLIGNKKKPNALLAQALTKAHQKYEKDSRNCPTSSENTPRSVGSDRFKDGESILSRRQSSRRIIDSLEFSEALPFAAFASMLVETVAKLDNVTEEVEKLGNVAHFKKYDPIDNVVIKCENPKLSVREEYLPTYGGE